MTIPPLPKVEVDRLAQLKGKQVRSSHSRHSQVDGPSARGQGVEGSPGICQTINRIQLRKAMEVTTGITRFGTAEDAAGGTRRPFSKAVRAGDCIYVSGQVPAVDGEIVTGGIIEQTELVMKNIVSALAEAGCGLEHVVKVNAWLDDPRDFTSFNSVFERHFRDHPPARSTVRAALMVDAKVEMDVIAYKPE